MKPADLDKFEAELDEAAFPFEEKAIKVHEKNMESLHAGVFNTWTEKSLSRLAVLMPGRYAKNEMSSGFIGAMDRYAYRSPLAPPVTQTASTTAATPATANATPGTNAAASPSAASANSGGSTTDQTPHPSPAQANGGGGKNANPR